MLTTACKEDPKRPPIESEGPADPGIGGVGGGNGGDASVAADGGIPDSGEADGGACTDLETTGAVIDQLGIVGDPPPGSGGTITDGTYDITNAQVFVGMGGLGGATGVSYQGSIRITGPILERFVRTTSSAGTIESRTTGTLQPSGVNASLALSCPSSAQEQVTYTASDTTLTTTNLVTKESFTFTKKP